MSYSIATREWYDDDTLNARITEELMFLDFPYAADRGFVPTSTHRNWGGKYRCVNCKSTGYFSKNAYPYWWGNTHGNNCRKKV